MADSDINKNKPDESVPSSDSAATPSIASASPFDDAMAAAASWSTTKDDQSSDNINDLVTRMKTTLNQLDSSSCDEDEVDVTNNPCLGNRQKRKRHRGTTQQPCARRPRVNEPTTSTHQEHTPPLAMDDGESDRQDKAQIVPVVEITQPQNVPMVPATTSIATTSQVVHPPPSRPIPKFITLRPIVSMAALAARVARRSGPALRVPNENADYENTSDEDQSEEEETPQLQIIRSLGIVPNRGDLVNRRNARTAGPYIIGEKIDQGPVPCITSFMARHKVSDEVVQLKILTLHPKEMVFKVPHGRMLINNEFSLLKRMGRMPGFIYQRGCFTDVAFEERMNSKNKAVYTGRLRKRVVLVLSPVVSNQFEPNSAPCIELQKFILQRQHLSENEAMVIFLEAVYMVEQLHEKNIIHRDLKTANIILNLDTFKIKLINYGLGKELKNEDEMLNDQRGSPTYIAPEVIQKIPYKGKPSDMWALGVMLYMMLFGMYPFFDRNLLMLFRKIRQGVFSFPDIDVSTSAKCLITNLLSINPEARMTAKQLRQELLIMRAARLAKHINIDQMVPKYEPPVEVVLKPGDLPLPSFEECDHALSLSVYRQHQRTTRQPRSTPTLFKPLSREDQQVPQLPALSISDAARILEQILHKSSPVRGGVEFVRYDARPLTSYERNALLHNIRNINIPSPSFSSLLSQYNTWPTPSSSLSSTYSSSSSSSSTSSNLIATTRPRPRPNWTLLPRLVPLAASSTTSSVNDIINGNDSSITQRLNDEYDEMAGVDPNLVSPNRRALIANNDRPTSVLGAPKSDDESSLAPTDGLASNMPMRRRTLLTRRIHTLSNRLSFMRRRHRNTPADMRQMLTHDLRSPLFYIARLHEWIRAHVNDSPLDTSDYLQLFTDIRQVFQQRIFVAVRMPNVGIFTGRVTDDLAIQMIAWLNTYLGSNRVVRHIMFIQPSTSSLSKLILLFKAFGVSMNSNDNVLMLNTHQHPDSKALLEYLMLAVGQTRPFFKPFFR